MRVAPSVALSLSLFACLLSAASALYSPRDDVVVVDEASFDKEVLRDAGVVAVEFFAPWCGHCKNLVPDWKKAAKALKGVVKVVGVDATAAQGLAARYGVQGYPTIKIFGANKEAPKDYNGARDAKAIVQECMRAAQDLVSSRIGGGPGGGGSSSSRGGGQHGSDFGGTALTTANFRTTVLESDEPWLVTFYAPWCGHCKRLEPEWQRAARTLEGHGFHLGSVDATAEQGLAGDYGVQGYPTIKYFFRGQAEDYSGPREASGIEDFAMGKLEAVGKDPEIAQLVGPGVWSKKCSARKNMLCIVAFLPHILDSGASGRTDYLDTLKAVAKKNRRSPVTFLWAEGGSQSALEDSLGGFGGYPTLAALSAEKKRYARMNEAFDITHISSFIVGVLTGKGTSAVNAFGAIATVEEWDGKDGELPEEEPLDAYDEVELDGTTF